MASETAPISASQEFGGTETSPAMPGRWWLGVLVGAMVALPLGWMLKLAGPLPFFLGVFFFALFGLVIGASMFRVALAGRPYSTTSVLVGTTIIVLGCWYTSLHFEAERYARTIGAEAVKRWSTKRVGDRPAAECRADVSQQFRDHLRRAHWPGGTLGYAQWALVDGALEKGELPGVTSRIKYHQRGWRFAVRTVLSIGLLAFGIASQTFSLRRKSPIGQVEERPGDDVETRVETGGETSTEAVASESAQRSDPAMAKPVAPTQAAK